MKKIARQGINITLFVFLMMWAVDKITDMKLFNAFDSFSMALKDFEVTDVVFSQIRADPLVDQRIVLVNLAPDRALIAQQIMKIKRHNPRVIGIDSFFNCEGGLYDTVNCPQLLDTLGSLLLANAIQEAGNVVLVSKLLQSKKLLTQGDVDVYDSIEYSDEIFRKHARNAFANLPTGANYQEDVKICRSVYPSMEVNEKNELAFGVQIAMIYDSVKSLKFLARGKDEEIINFRGNVELQNTRLGSIASQDIATTRYPIMFYAVDWMQLLGDEYLEEIFKDNIVMIGSLGSYFGDPNWEDKFFTPLNKKAAGRANPDMFGLVVHANVVAMILNEDYVAEVADWLEVIIAIITCYLTVLLFITIDKKLPNWYDALSVTIQVVQLILITFIIVQAFAWFTLKFDLGLTLLATALVGPSYDIYKGFELEITGRLTKRRQRVSKQE